MSKITIYEVQERMPRMETLVELWEASVRVTHHFIVNRSFFCNNIHSYQFIKNIHKSRSAGNI